MSHFKSHSKFDCKNILRLYEQSLLYGSYACAQVLHPLLDSSFKIEYDSIINRMMEAMYNADYDCPTENTTQILESYHLTLRFIIDIGVSVPKNLDEYIFHYFVVKLYSKKKYSEYISQPYFHQIINDLIELGGCLEHSSLVTSCVFADSYGGLLLLDELNILELNLKNISNLHEYIHISSTHFYDIMEIIFKYKEFTRDEIVNILNVVIKQRMYCVSDLAFKQMLQQFFNFFKTRCKIVLTDFVLNTILTRAPEGIELILENVDYIDIHQTYDLNKIYIKNTQSQCELGTIEYVYATLKKFNIDAVWDKLDSSI